jgi:hypothetical protein
MRLSLPRLPLKGGGATPSLAEESRNDGAANRPVSGEATLTAAMVESVRFTISEPEGYFFPQVEEFVTQVRATLRNYEERHYQDEARAVELENELELQIHDVRLLRSQIEVFTVQGSPLVNPDGSYVTESQQSGVPALQAELARVEAALAEARTGTATAEAALAASLAAADQTATELADLRAWADAVVPEYEAMQAAAEASTAALAEAQATIAALQGALEAAHAAPEPVLVPVPALVPDPEPVAPLPHGDVTGDFAEDGSGQGYEPDPEDVLPSGMPDSELPPGVVLSSTGDAAPAYAPASPGAPLTTVAGPMDQWAPELGAARQQTRG